MALPALTPKLMDICRCRRIIKSPLSIWLSSMKLCGSKLVSPPNWPHLMFVRLTCVIGNLTELMGDLEGAVNAYEQAMRHNQYSIQAMNAISCILRTKENFPRAVEYLQGILKLDGTNGEVWGSLGKPRTIIIA